MSKTRYQGEQDAYYGFGKCCDEKEYVRGYNQTTNMLEQEEYQRMLDREYIQQCYEQCYDEWCSYQVSKLRDCRP